MQNRVLVVDDEALIRWSLRERLAQEGYEVAEAATGAEARRLATKDWFDLALLDLRLPDIDGIALLHQLREIHGEMPVIIITAYSSVESAVEAMRCGAVNYIRKPFNMDELSMAVQKALETAGLRRQVSTQARDQKARFGLPNLIGESPVMQEIKRLIRRVSRSESTTVLLLGESGTGKDMLARAIHYESNRVEKPFVNITCTALPENLLESELFGYEKGAFTDARERKKGLFELADGGTVFLDEIGDMGPDLQAKLLRVLEESAFKRLGGVTDVQVDVRIVAATNRDLDEALRQQRFREDLYYRLSTLPITIPPLRERREDIPPLARHFLPVYNHEFHRTFTGFAPEAMERLYNYDWPGNVRELRNVIERAVLLGDGDTIQAEEIVLGRAPFRGAAQVGQPRRLAALPPEGCSLDNVEKELIEQALERTSGNRTRAAELLGITRDQVRYKIAKYGLE